MLARQVEAEPAEPAVVLDACDPAAAVDVAEHHMAAHAVERPQRALDVEPFPRVRESERAAVERLCGRVGGEAVVRERCDGEADAVDRDALARDQGVVEGDGQAHGEDHSARGTPGRLNLSNPLYQAGEHGLGLFNSLEHAGRYSIGEMPCR